MTGSVGGQLAASRGVEISQRCPHNEANQFPLNLRDSMSVQSREDEIRVSAMTLDARFDDGYRYFDRMGNAASRIRRECKPWILHQIGLPQTSVLNHEDDLLCRFDEDLVVVGRKTDVWIPTRDAGAIARKLGESAERLYQVLVETFDVPNTTRIGTRYWFIAPAESLEDAQRFLVKVSQSDLCSEVLNASSAALYNSSFRFHVEDDETGYRRTINITTATRRKPGEPAITGLPGESPESGVMIDIDTFTRPKEGHFDGVNLFVQNNYHSSHGFALRLFGWLRKNQKK